MRTTNVYPDEFPESWTSNWDEDEYGLIMGFSYKGVRQDFRWIELGTFLMGSPEDEMGRNDDRETQHEVTLTEGFWIADTVVTQALWQVFMGNNPSQSKGANCPVEIVTWDETQVFINKLNGMKLALNLCLPSEAQWEYACRAGTTTAFHFGGKDDLNLDKMHYSGKWDNANKWEGETRAVKSYPPNDWGLYEMHGNVLEWCQDWYGSYPAQPVTDPHGSQFGVHRVSRGGSWVNGGRLCRSANRGYNDPTYCIYRNVGFRLTRSHS